MMCARVFIDLFIYLSIYLCPYLFIYSFMWLSNLFINYLSYILYIYIYMPHSMVENFMCGSLSVTLRSKKWMPPYLGNSWQY